MKRKSIIYWIKAYFRQSECDLLEAHDFSNSHEPERGHMRIHCNRCGSPFATNTLTRPFSIKCNGCGFGTDGFETPILATQEWYRINKPKGSAVPTEDEWNTFEHELRDQLNHPKLNRVLHSLSWEKTLLSHPRLVNFPEPPLNWKQRILKWYLTL